MLGAVWRGKRPLVETFWFWGIFGTFVLNVLEISYASRPPAGAAADPLATLLIAANGLWRAFMLVAVWRSARRHALRPGWRTAARGVWLLVLGEWLLRMATRYLG